MWKKGIPPGSYRVSKGLGTYNQTINCHLFSKTEEMGLLLLHVPFNYVSLFTMPFPKCLPRCLFSLQDAEVTAEM